MWLLCSIQQFGCADVQAAVRWSKDVVAEYLPGLPPPRFRSLLLRMLFLEPSHTAFFTQVPPPRSPKHARPPA